RLRGWKVAPVHARIEHSLAGLFVEDVSRGYELRVNDQLVSRHGPLEPGDAIGIGGYLVRVRALQTQDGDEPPLPEGDGSLQQVPLSPVEGAVQGDAEALQQSARYQAYMEWSRYIQGELFRALDLRRMNLDSMDHEQVRATLSGLIDEERPRAFFDHIRNKDYGMAPEFPADKRTLSQFRRFTGRAEGLSISFEAHLLGSKIEYDEARDMLIIRQLPTQLKDQLKRRKD
ncbi:TPA: nucleoid-associated protein, partial [Klebsiella pneumoniae]